MTREDVKYFANCLKNNYKMDFNTMEMFCNAVIESQNKLQKIENIMNEMQIDTIVKKLEKETVSRESYEHEYLLRKEFDFKAYKLERQFDKIRDEIIDAGAYEQKVHGKTEFLDGINYCLEVIDKYKESEDKK